ncbi:MAG: ArsI/CadI family heavy metal resistance metalloenzyme [Bacteroidota bacterium]
MKRLHVSLSVKDLQQSVEFYKHLFDAAPTVIKEDYAKWMLDDPLVNFAINSGGKQMGLQHLGIQVENEDELQEVYQNFGNTEGELLEEGHTVCCYAQSEKSWVKDPQGVEWEAFHTYGTSEVKKVSDTQCCEDTCCA